MTVAWLLCKHVIAVKALVKPDGGRMAENRQEHDELTFSEAMLSDIAADMEKVRRNTSFMAGVLLGYMTLISLLFVLNIVASSSSS